MKRLFDEPNGRSASRVVVPTLGGLAVYLGMIGATTTIVSWVSLPNMSLILGCMTIILFLGLKDDILVLSPSKKIMVQLFVATLLVVGGGFRLTSFHCFLGVEGLPFIASFIISTFACIVIINAFNIIDGIDGLASGLSICILTVLGIWFAINGVYEFSIYCFTMAGGLSSFFYFNIQSGKNKIFMGDTGSMLIGVFMFILIIEFNTLNNMPDSIPYPVDSSPIVSFGILSYPLYDVIRVFVIRTIQHKSPLKPDKNHIHHRLLALGFSHIKSTTIILAFNVFLIGSVFLLQSIGNEWLMLYIFTILGVASTIPSFIIHHKGLILKDDPYQQVMIPRLFSKEDKLFFTDRHAVMKPKRSIKQEVQSSDIS
ncbi:undecaprenyl/decaprenyl-phosphate alpha-N-acetylglucosaminyl 1-phosphate transferase [Halosquirtibacter laminarini]|uniref:Undecaprenyl/decaprenyl-phosphate alpha-N-acetylglucosaminyl 1-phosphate transferase n=1 Tax=Halosquirtibacter laminarini TaxID=3374600 RepID=A0AC61NMP9_9BACT|nr:undecaprenyl/decaprenyl-phosphate alpha-N-acetylglucosaminyl 1-phosphate transferase [Prolixibacteraceae bacterium]